MHRNKEEDIIDNEMSEVPTTIYNMHSRLIVLLQDTHKSLADVVSKLDEMYHQGLPVKEAVGVSTERLLLFEDQCAEWIKDGYRIRGTFHAPLPKRDGSLASCRSIT